MQSFMWNWVKVRPLSEEIKYEEYLPLFLTSQKPNIIHALKGSEAYLINKGACIIYNAVLSLIFCNVTFSVNSKNL